MLRLRLFQLSPILCCLILLLSPQSTTAQDSLRFFDIIQYDSVALYFNEDFIFTERECYDYVRHVRVNSNGDFNGYFEDKSFDDVLLGKGVYYGGIKHGYFEIFYPNGKIFSRGYYENNKPVGIWNFFYPSGLPERTLEITDSTILLLTHVSEGGTIRVQNGTGKFMGMVASSIDYSGIMAAGNVVNGKPEGKWIVPNGNLGPSYAEKFHNGTLIKSSQTSKRKMKIAKQQPALSNFLLNNYLGMLENFDRQNCSESQKYFFTSYPNDLRSFTVDLRERINYLIETDIRSRQEENYEIGNNYMTIQFSINEKGKAYNIVLTSEWGNRFFEITKNAINKTVFSPNHQTMYFHFKLSYSGNRKYRYTFRFAKRDRVK